MKNKKNNLKEKQEFKKCKCGAVGNWFIGDLCVKCDREKNKNENNTNKISTSK